MCYVYYIIILVLIDTCIIWSLWRQFVGLFVEIHIFLPDCVSLLFHFESQSVCSKNDNNVNDNRVN